MLLTFSSRRIQREVATVDVWPASPRAPARELYVCNLMFIPQLFTKFATALRDINQARGLKDDDLQLQAIRLRAKRDDDESEKTGERVTGKRLRMMIENLVTGHPVAAEVTMIVMMRRRKNG